MVVALQQPNIFEGEGRKSRKPSAKAGHVEKPCFVSQQSGHPGQQSHYKASNKVNNERSKRKCVVVEASRKDRRKVAQDAPQSSAETDQQNLLQHVIVHTTGSTAVCVRSNIEYPLML